MTPSNANTSGLEVVAWRRHDVLRNGAYFADRKETAKMWFDRGLSPEPLVTAASAQARIAELKARFEAADLALAITKMMVGDQERRATAAEARTDRLADIVRRCVSALDASRSGGDYPDFEEWEKDARAALQQEG